MEWNGIMMFDVVFARKACMADSHELTIITFTLCFFITLLLITQQKWDL